MKMPGPGHSMTIAPNPKRVRVTFAGRVVADTTRALTVREATLPVADYIPREDVDLSLLAPADTCFTCPYKGEATRYSVIAGGRVAESAAWSFEHPYSCVAALAGRLTFVPEAMDAIEELPR
jgi:uncharacterized protein (DUF427 family)